MITNLIFIIGVIVFITFITGIFMIGKDEKLDAKIINVALDNKTAIKKVNQSEAIVVFTVILFI